MTTERIAVPTINERRTLARTYVGWGRRVIARQQRYVKELRESGRDTEAAEKLLAVLERTHKVFEHDLADLEKRE
jgi:hypothetical protein